MSPTGATVRGSRLLLSLALLGTLPASLSAQDAPARAQNFRQLPGYRGHFSSGPRTSVNDGDMIGEIPV